MVDGHVLVLNRLWVAVHITPARRALTLMYLGAARAVHPADYSLYAFDDWLELSQDGLGGRYVHTPSLRIRIPEVIQLTLFNGFVRHQVRFSRHNVFERDSSTCQYCGRRFPRSQLTIDHVIPQSRGGGETWENLVLACVECNVRKGNRTPEEAGMPLIRRPIRPAWMPHFGRRVPSGQLASWQRFVDARQWGLTAREGA
ncbi:MAG: HNH endonuclease [Candidatus Hydrogenedentes bacterium]|nr:HNH endonuclease [Candidatus Hydrogenedentota bacterium]